MDFLEMMFEGFSFQDGWPGFFMACFFTTIAGFCLLLVIAGAVWLADNVGMEHIQGQGKVHSREFVPEHTTTSTSTVNGVTTVTVTNHPDAWHITIKREEETSTIEVTYDTYNRLIEGDRVGIMFVTGRFTKSFYLKEILED